MASAAFADTFQVNDLDLVEGVRTTQVTVPASGSTSFSLEFRLQGVGGDGGPTGGGAGACNVSSSAPGTMVFGSPSTLPAGVAATAGTSWSTCDTHDVAFSVASTALPGTYAITPIMTGGVSGTYDNSGAAFNLIVSAPTPSDAVPPITTASVTSGTPGNNGWYTTDVTVSLSAADDTGGSGVKEIIYSLSGATTLGSTTVAGTSTLVNLGNEGTTTITFQARDNAGNLETAQTLDVKIDKTAPSASLAVFAGTAGTNDWYTTDLTIRTSGSDATSGIASCTGDQFQTAETTGATFNGACTDSAGWTTNAASLSVKLDKTGPTAALSVFDGTLGLGGWYVTDVTVRTTGTDTISNPTTCSAEQTLTDEATGQPVNGSCTNDAGLTTNAAPLTIKIDKSGPTVTPGSVTDPAWRNTPLSEEFTASDDYSGLNLSAGALSGTNKFTLTAAAESADAFTPTVVSGTVYDNAGHGTTRFVSAKIDLTDPTVTCGSTPTFALNQSGATVSATVSDGLSGPVSASVSGAANTALVSGGTVALTGTDAAGNSTTVNCPYNVASVIFGKPIEGPSVMNIAKLGRVIPVKATVLLNGTAIGSSDGPVSIGGLGNVNCQTGVTSDTVEEYAAAGSSNYGNLFRWDSTEGRWMYNYDTSALKGNNCYRINVHLGGAADENGRVTGGTNIGYFLIKVGK